MFSVVEPESTVCAGLVPVPWMVRVLSIPVLLSTESSPAVVSVSVIEAVKLIVLLAETLLSAAVGASAELTLGGHVECGERDARFKRLKRCIQTPAPATRSYF